MKKILYIGEDWGWIKHNNIYELEKNKLEEVLFIEDIIKRSSICEMEASS